MFIFLIISIESRRRVMIDPLTSYLSEKSSLDEIPHSLKVENELQLKNFIKLATANYLKGLEKEGISKKSMKKLNYFRTYRNNINRLRDIYSNVNNVFNIYDQGEEPNKAQNIKKAGIEGKKDEKIKKGKQPK